MKKYALTDGSLVVRMQSTEIGCAMCNVSGDHSHSVPWNGAPVSEAAADGCYKVVCGACYVKWLAWDNRRRIERATVSVGDWKSPGAFSGDINHRQEFGKD